MMMYPSSASSSSAHSASVRVEKATSEFLNGPDWTINIDICDAINLNHWLAKDIVKALKKRLQHKNSHVHLLALTLLETMVKNCGEPVHSQIVERNILQDMIKIVKKKTNMIVRDKILVLLDSWQQAFGGAGGKYPQYYWAYEELRRSGVEFPQRTSDSALIFTPPATHSTVGRAHAGYGMPSNSSTRLDEAMASEIETLSLSGISSMQEVLDLLSAMLQAVDPNDRMAIHDEVIVDLVDRCRSNHKKLMQMLTTTGDEELLAKGLELNDGIQNELAKHDAIAAGHPLPTQVMSSKPQLTEVPSSSLTGDEGSKFSSPPPAVSSAPSTVVPSAPSTVVPSAAPSTVVPSAPSTVVPAAPSTVVINAAAEEEEEEDEFAQLARRHSKTHSATSQNTFVGASEAEPSMSNALVISDPPVPVKITKEQDMIDFLSLALSTTGTSPRAPESSAQNMQQAPVSPSGQGSPYARQTYTGNQGQVPFSSYVAPWAQPQPQIQQQAQLRQQPPPQQQQHQTQGQPPQAQYQIQAQSPQFSSGYPPGQPQQPQFRAQAQSPQFSSGYPPGQPQQPQYQTHGQHQQPQYQTQGQPQQPQFQRHGQHQQPQYQTQGQPQQPQFQTQAQTTQYSTAYPPPPWAATPGYYTNPRQQLNTAANRPMQGAGSLQQVNSAHGAYAAGDGQISSRPTGNAPAGQKTFIPSYRLFEDLNVLGNGDGRSKTNNTSPSLSGTTQSMGGGWK